MGSTMMAFAPEAVAVCAEQGHRWRWVRSWHSVGFEECGKCGESRNYGTHTEASPPETVVLPSPTPYSNGPRDAEIARRILSGESNGPALAREFGVTTSRVYQIRRRHLEQQAVAV